MQIQRDKITGKIEPAKGFREAIPWWEHLRIHRK